MAGGDLFMKGIAEAGEKEVGEEKGPKPFGVPEPPSPSRES